MSSYSIILLIIPEDNEVTDPIEVPENVRAKVISSTSAWLMWFDPALGRAQQISDSRYYNVHYHVRFPHFVMRILIIYDALFLLQSSIICDFEWNTSQYTPGI